MVCRDLIAKILRKHDVSFQKKQLNLHLFRHLCLCLCHLSQTCCLAKLFWSLHLPFPWPVEKLCHVCCGIHTGMCMCSSRNNMTSNPKCPLQSKQGTGPTSHEPQRRTNYQGHCHVVPSTEARGKTGSTPHSNGCLSHHDKPPCQLLTYHGSIEPRMCWCLSQNGYGIY